MMNETKLKHGRCRVTLSQVCVTFYSVFSGNTLYSPFCSTLFLSSCYSSIYTDSVWSRFEGNQDKVHFPFRQSEIKGAHYCAPPSNMITIILTDIRGLISFSLHTHTLILCIYAVQRYFQMDFLPLDQHKIHSEGEKYILWTNKK